MENDITKRVKKRLNKKLIYSFLLCFIMLVGGISIKLKTSNPKIDNSVIDTGLKTTEKEIPTNADPSKESDLDNLAYLAYYIANNDYKSESRGTANASILGIPYVQEIHDARIVSGDYKLQQTISKSSFVSFALQRFYFKDKVIRRDGKVNSVDDVTWSDDIKDAITYKLALETYGTTCDSISQYILCSDSILSHERINNGDNGLYEIKYTLNPNVAPYYYQRQVKEFAGANDYPAFTNIELTFTFNSNYQVISVKTNETYQISMMGMNLTITTDILESFSYDDISIDCIDFYKQYESVEPIGEKSETKLTAQSLLLESFSDLLNGSIETYSLVLNINNYEFNILISLDLNNGLYKFNVEDLIYGIYDQNNNKLYLNYDKLNLNLDINEVSNLTNQVTNICNLLGIDLSNTLKDTTNISFDITQIDTNALVNSIISSDITIGEDNSATINPSLDICGISIPLTFKFKYDGSKYSLDYLDSTINVSDNLNISIHAKEIDKSLDFEINDSQNISDISALLDNVTTLLENDLIEANINVNYNNILVSGTINYKISENKLGSDLDITYNNTLIHVNVYYYNNIVTIKYNDIIVSSSIDNISTLIQSLGLNVDTNIDTNTLVKTILNIDINKTINSIIINKDKLTVTLYYKNNSYNLSVLNNIDNSIAIALNDILNINLHDSNTDIVIPQSNDISNLFDLIKLVLNSESNAFNININSNIKYNDYTFNIIGNLYIDKSLNIKFNGTIKYNDYTIKVDLIYTNNTIYLTVFNRTIEYSLSNNNSQTISISNIDIDSILNIFNNFSYNVTNNESNIILDVKFNIKDIEVSNLSLDISETNVEDINIPAIDITSDDVNNIINIVKDSYNVLTNKFNINTTLNLNLLNQDIKLDIDLNIDLSNNYYSGLIKVNALNNTFNVYVVYTNNALSIKLTDNLSASLNNEEIKKLVEYITNKFNINTDSSIDITNIDINSILDKITLSTTSNTVTLGYDQYNLELVDNSDYLVANISGINNVDTISLNINNNYKEYVIDNTTLEYNDLINIINTVYDSYNVLTNKFNINTTLNLNLLNQDIKLDIDLNIDLSNNYYSGLIKVNVLNTITEIYVAYTANSLSISIGNVGIAITNNEIKDLINYINTNYNLGLNSTLDTNTLDINSILDKITLSTTSNSITLGYDKYNLELVDNSDYLVVNISGINNLDTISLNINNNYKEYVIDNTTLGYNDIITILDSIDDFKELVSREKYNITFKTDIILNNEVRYNVSATLKVKVLSDGSFNLEAKLDIIALLDSDHDYTIDFTLIDNYVYAKVKFAERSNTNYDFLNVKITYKDLLSIVGTVTKFAGINIDFLDKFITYDNLNKDTLGYLIPDNKDSDPINISNYLSSLVIYNDSIKLGVNGNLLFNSNEDLIITLSKDNSTNYNKLEIDNIYSRNNNTNVEKFNVELNLIDEDFDITSPTEDYIDISSINSLLEAFLNTASLNDFNISGSLTAKMSIIGIDINMTIDYEILVKLYDKVPTVVVKLKNIPVIVGVNNDVTYSFGDTSGGNSRNFTIYYQNGSLYLYREESVSRFASSSETYERKLMTTLNQALSDPYYYFLQFGIGLSDDIINSMKSGLGTSTNSAIDLAKLIKGYTFDGTNYNLVLSLAEISGNSELGDLSITISTTEIDDRKYLSNLSVSTSISLSVLTLDISTTDCTLNNIKGNVDISELDNYISSYPYLMDQYYEGRDGSLSLKSEVTYTITYNLNNGLDNVIQTYRCNDSINLYHINDIVIIEGSIYKFLGFYYNDSLFDLTVMDRSNYVLEAKYELIEEEFKAYVDDELVTVNFTDALGYYYTNTDTNIINIYQCDTYYDVLKDYVLSATLVDNYYFIDYKLYTNIDLEGYYYIIVLVESKYVNNQEVGYLIKDGNTISTMPSYTYNIYEVNAYFTTSDLSIDNIVLDLSKLNSNTYLYPYYSTNTQLLTSEDNALTGVNIAIDTLIVPLYINGVAITEIKASAFESNSSIKTLVLSNYITTLNSNSFKCSSLTKIYITESVSSIADDAFYMDTTNRISDITFYNNSSLDLSKLKAYKKKIIWTTTYYYSNNGTAFDLSETINSIAK